VLQEQTAIESTLSMTRIGIDLGGTKIECVLLANDGSVLWRHRVATPVGDYAATLDAIACLVESAERACGAGATVGVATPGAISLATGFTKNANSTCLNGRHLKTDLESLIGREIRIANDANCFALSEAVDGAAQGARVVFGVILGTGVGGGVVVNGHVIAGANSIAGEFGHNPLPAPNSSELPGPRCYCGRNGCIETWLSGPGLASDHARATGDVITAETIVARWITGDRECDATLSRYEDRLARSLA